MVTNTKSAPSRKILTDCWEWRYNGIKKRWETYISPHNCPNGLYQWMFENFGIPTGTQSAWNYHGGSIYIYREVILILFTLRWG